MRSKCGPDSCQPPHTFDANLCLPLSFTCLHTMSSSVRCFACFRFSHLASLFTIIHGRRPACEIMECPICLQICIHPSKLPCGHIFCFLCVKVICQCCAIERTCLRVPFMCMANECRKGAGEGGGRGGQFQLQLKSISTHFCDRV